MNYSVEKTEHLLMESRAIYPIIEAPLKFIVDAQLPKKLADFLMLKGFVAIHTLELPEANNTTDKYIKNKASKEGLILITKDDDFLRSFIIEHKPQKLILIKTGNLNNRDLLDIFDKKLHLIASLITQYSMLEITNKEIIAQ